MNPTAAPCLRDSGRLLDFPLSSPLPSDLAYAQLSSPRCHVACVVVDIGSNKENLQQQVSQLHQAARWVVDASKILLVWFGQKPGVFGLQRGESGSNVCGTLHARYVRTAFDVLAGSMQPLTQLLIINDECYED